MKNEMYRMVREYQSKGYAEDCNYMPCEIVEIVAHRDDPWGAYIDLISLVDPTKGMSCSFFHCNAKALTQKEAFERRDCFINEGAEEYFRKYFGDDT